MIEFSMSAEAPSPCPLVDEAVVDRLERVVRRSDGFSLSFVKSNHRGQSIEASAVLRRRLGNAFLLELQLNHPVVSLLDVLTEHVGTGLANRPAAISVLGLEKSINEQREGSAVLGRLNNDRDLIRERIQRPLLIWLPDFALDCLARGAPDFWAWRSGVFQFSTSPSMWRQDSDAALEPIGIPASSLDAAEKHQEAARLEELIRASLALPAPDRRDAGIRGQLYFRLGSIYFNLGQLDRSQAQFEESLAVARTLGNRGGTGASLNNLGLVKHYQGDFAAARRLYSESLDMSKRVGDDVSVGSTLLNLGVLEQEMGDWDQAHGYYAESLRTAKRVGDQRGIANALHQLAIVAAKSGDLTRAQRLFEAALGIDRRLGNKRGIAASLHELAGMADARGDVAEARRLYGESIEMKRRLGDQRGLAMSLHNLGLVAEQEGAREEAAKLYSESAEILADLGAHEIDRVYDSLVRVHRGGAG